MMRIFLFLLFTTPIIFLFGCTPQRRSAPVGGPAASNAAACAITPQQAKDVMDEGGAFILLDVRTQAEFDAGHIAGAILIPDDEIGDRAEAELPDKATPILVYCRTGRRSAGAANALASLGYTDVRDFGGILDWPFGTVRN